MSKVVLSERHVTPDSPISVQLIKNHHAGARAVVVITWPCHRMQPSKARRRDQQPTRLQQRKH